MRIMIYARNWILPTSRFKSQTLKTLTLNNHQYIRKNINFGDLKFVSIWTFKTVNGKEKSGMNILPTHKWGFFKGKWVDVVLFMI